MKISTTSKKRLIEVGITIISVLLIAFIIELISMIKANEVVFPNIFNILGGFFRVLGEGLTYSAIGYTILRLLVSVLISFVIGGILGLLAGNNHYISVFLKPIMTLLRSLPIIILVVIILLLTKISLIPYIATIIILIPIIYEEFNLGVRSFDKDLMDFWHLYSKFNFNVIRRVHIPLLSKSIRVSLINSLSMGIKVLITTEYLSGTKDSLGYLIINSRDMVEYDLIYAYSLVIVIIILLIEYIPRGIVRLYKYLKYERVK